MRLRICGRVQGVFYRDSTRREARRLGGGVRGYGDIELERGSNCCSGIPTLIPGRLPGEFRPAETRNITLTLYNYGNGPASMELALAAPANWTIGGWNATPTVAAWSNNTVIVQLTAPAGDVVAGSGALYVLLQHGSEAVFANDTLLLNQTHRLRVLVAGDSALPEQNGTATATIRNRGDGLVRIVLTASGHPLPLHHLRGALVRPPRHSRGGRAVAAGTR